MNVLEAFDGYAGREDPPSHMSFVNYISCYPTNVHMVHLALI